MARPTGAIVQTHGQPSSLTSEVHAQNKALVGDLLAKGYLSPRVKDMEQGALIIAKGQEVGFGPMESLRQIYVIGGVAAMQADGMRSLLLRSGCVQIMDIEHTPDKAVVRMVRTNAEGKVTADYTAEFTRERAQAANFKSPLYANNGLREVMLRHKATGEAARAVGADIIGGMYTPEEFGVATLEDLTPDVVSSVLSNADSIGDEGSAAIKALALECCNAGVTTQQQCHGAFNDLMFRHGAAKLAQLREEQAAPVREWLTALRDGGLPAGTSWQQAALEFGAAQAPVDEVVEGDFSPDLTGMEAHATAPLEPTKTPMDALREQAAEREGSVGRLQMGAEE